ncbi:MAG TPA: 2,3-bisphosphoglycerate-independent phosphoglycerate mutase, partial [Thermoleophilaceae bacterium]|nr:2,3-bisphosphoglycerate-independent phosphoglycerate mutase [Thermoleophilaceae bacterium]
MAAVCLVVLDGWGLAPPGPGNAVDLAETPVFDELWGTCPRTTLETSGPAVGLPVGQMGNSEVGHLNLGAGSVVRQDLARIDEAVADGSFRENPALRAACEEGRRAGRIHLLGLVSDGGVHASLAHLRAAAGMAAEAGVPDVVVHAFTDGRDTPPDSGAGHLAATEQALREIEGRTGSRSRVGTVTGRYFAMDRDERWDRTKLAYDAIVHGRAEAPPADDGEAAV